MAPGLTTQATPWRSVTDEHVIARLTAPDLDLSEVWELCVSLEWQRAAAVDGIARWLGALDGLRVLDCACGSGFPAIDLIGRGYDVTCSDGSRRMLRLFRDNARRAGVPVEPALVRWNRLATHFAGGFDAVLCRGCSLPYAGTWDHDAEPDRQALVEAVAQFAACLRPGGRLYVDIPRVSTLAATGPRWTRYPAFVAGGHVVELEECLTNHPARGLRLWHVTLRIDGVAHEFDRRSHYLRPAELIALMEAAGLTGVRATDVEGESYAVFVGRRAAA